MDRFTAAHKAAGFKKQGDKWQCPCTANHTNGDRNPSMTVDEGAGGILVYCHSQHCDGREIAAALGLDPSDLFDNPRGRGDAGNIDYMYADEAGVVLFRVQRQPLKQFRQHRHDPAHPDAGPDGFVASTGNMDGVRRVPYRLPDLIAGVKAGRTIYIAEG